MLDFSVTRRSENGEVLEKAGEFFIKFKRNYMKNDCRSILWLKICKSSNDVLIRYGCILTAYELTLTHIPGKENTITFSKNVTGDVNGVNMFPSNLL